MLFWGYGYGKCRSQDTCLVASLAVFDACIWTLEQQSKLSENVASAGQQQQQQQKEKTRQLKRGDLSEV